MNDIKSAQEQEAAVLNAQKEAQGTKVSEDALEVLLMHELLKKRSRQEQGYT